MGLLWLPLVPSLSPHHCLRSSLCDGQGGQGQAPGEDSSEKAPSPTSVPLRAEPLQRHPGGLGLGKQGPAGIWVIWRGEGCSCWGHLDPGRAVFSDYFCLPWEPDPRVQPPGSSRAQQVHRFCPASLCPFPGQPWVGAGAEGPGDGHLHAPPGCLASLGVTRGRDRCWAQLPSDAPLRAQPGLALIDYTGASVRAQVAGLGQPLAPKRHGPAGAGECERKESWGRASVSPN